MGSEHTMQVSKYCEENQVILYLLPPNTTHILQPADVEATYERILAARNS